MKFIIMVRKSYRAGSETMRPVLYIVEKETEQCWFVLSTKSKFKNSYRKRKKDFAWKLFDDVDVATEYLNNMKIGCGVYEAEDALTRWKELDNKATESVKQFITGFENSH